MKKKGYIAPHTEEYKINALQLLLVGSVLDEDSDSQEITPSDEPHNGEFNMPGLLDII